jgi:hypothetical protein
MGEKHGQESDEPEPVELGQIEAVACCGIVSWLHISLSAEKN